MYDSVIQVWNNRYQWVFTNNPQYGLLSFNFDYMQWYLKITRKFITVKAAVKGTMHDAHKRMYYMMSLEGRHHFSVEEMTDLLQNCLYLDHVEDCILELARVDHPPMQQGPINDFNVHVNIPSVRREGKGLQRRRTTIESGLYTLPPMGQRQEGFYHVSPQYPFYHPEASSSSTYYYPSQASGGESMSRNPYTAEFDA